MPASFSTIVRCLALLSFPVALTAVASGCVIRERYYYMDGEESDDEDTAPDAGTKRPDAGASRTGTGTNTGTNTNTGTGTNTGTNTSTTGGTATNGTTGGTTTNNALTCSSRGSCVLGPNCQDYFYGDPGALSFSQACTSAGGTFSSGACSHQNAVGGCQIDGSTATTCAKPTTWYYAPTPVSTVQAACSGPSSRFNNP